MRECTTCKRNTTPRKHTLMPQVFYKDNISETLLNQVQSEKKHAREKLYIHRNLTTTQEISSELFLLTASSVRCFAAARASFIFFMASTTSWFVITWHQIVVNKFEVHSQHKDTQIKKNKNTGFKLSICSFAVCVCVCNDRLQINQPSTVHHLLRQQTLFHHLSSPTSQKVRNLNVSSSSYHRMPALQPTAHQHVVRPLNP